MVDWVETALKPAIKSRHCFVAVSFCLLLAGVNDATAARELINCPDAVSANQDKGMLKGWRFYNKGPGKLSGAWIMRLGDHYEEMPDPDKTIRTQTAEKQTVTDFFHLTPLVGKPWTLYCEYGGKETDNTLLWRELPRLLTACEITKHQNNSGKEFEAHCK